MLPDGNDLFWKWKNIYEDFIDPFTKTVDEKFFCPILDTQLKYCKKTDIPLSIAILNVQNPLNLTNNIPQLETYFLTKKITDKIEKRLSANDMIFYNGKQTFLFLFPNTDKKNIQKLMDNIEIDFEQIFVGDTPLIIKAGYAEFPTDAACSQELRECAQKALAVAGNFSRSRIVGYFTERRNSLRVPLQVETRYVVPGFCGRLTCSRNIGEFGIMVSGFSDLPLGDNIKLTFVLPKIIKDKITVTAKTIWSKIISYTGKMDTGLCFTNVDNNEKEQIRNFIKDTYSPLRNSHL